MKLSFVLAVVLVAAGGASAPATAQTGYGDPCNPAVSTQNLGSQAVGQVVTYQLRPTCVLTTGAVLTVTVNGVNIPGKVADANGGVQLTVRVLSATQLEIDDPVNVPAVCGTNTVVVRGPSRVAANTTVNHTGTFTVTCPASTQTGTVPRTGSSALRWATVAGALVAIGALFLLAERRRSTRWSGAA